jgi:hydrogenase maturation protein HypF
MNSIVEHLLNKQPVAEIALGFHHSLVMIFTQLAEIVRGKYHINKVVLSGGCFQNYYLNKMFNQTLRQHGFTVLNHRIVPPNDGGISLGQAVVAAMNLDH